MSKIRGGGYYSIWIICGRGDGLPDGSDCGLIDQFIDAVNEFWMKGNVVVWWADNDPYFFEVNRWLQRTNFHGQGKLGFMIIDNYIGTKLLHRGDINVTKTGVFSHAEDMDFGCYHRHSLAHNLAHIYEGVTISHPEPAHAIRPFIPFSYATNGDLCTIYYLSDYHCPLGDVIIDCGFTKLFIDMKTGGTLRYVQNIVALTMQHEKKLMNTLEA
jgi:hypothetical protein